MATLLLMNRNRGIFTNETFTYYRQYNNNTSGVSDFSKKSIINDFNTKINHYKYFNSLKLDNKKKILILKENLEKIKKDKNYFKTFLRDKKNIKNFWWAMLGKKIFIVAEIGANHNGDLNLAKKMIYSAKEMWL